MDYEISIKFKNAPLLNLMRGKGLNTAAELHRETGVAQTEIGLYLNLKKSPLTSNGLVRNSAQILADYFCVTADLLFPESVIYCPLDCNESSFQIEHETMEMLADNSQELKIESLGSGDIFDALINSTDEAENKFVLTKREKEVITSRYEKEETLKLIGDRLGVTPTRVREIEAKALRKLRINRRHIENYLS